MPPRATPSRQGEAPVQARETVLQVPGKDGATWSRTARRVEGATTTATATAGLEADLALAWKAVRRLVGSCVTAAFPFLFILDRRVDWPMSPVLPGLAALAVILLLAPFACMEVLGRAMARRDAARRSRNAGRLRRIAQAAMAVAGVWFLAWLAWGP